MTKPLVGIIMGSRSDWDALVYADDMLNQLSIPHEVEIISAHRTPDRLFEYAASAESRGLEVIIAGAGGAAHLPGMCAAKTIIPVLGVPVVSGANYGSGVLHGLDAILSMVSMPAGVGVGTLSTGKAGAINAALLAAQFLGMKYPEIREAFRKWREKQTADILRNSDPREPTK